jgi:hypothetical protein
MTVLCPVGKKIPAHSGIVRNHYRIMKRELYSLAYKYIRDVPDIEYRQGVLLDLSERF